MTIETQLATLSEIIEDGSSDMYLVEAAKQRRAQLLLRERLTPAEIEDERTDDAIREERRAEEEGQRLQAHHAATAGRVSITTVEPRPTALPSVRAEQERVAQEREIYQQGG